MMVSEEKKKINFREAGKLIRSLQKLHAGFEGMFADEPVQKERIRAAAGELQLALASSSLSEIPVEELEKSRAGIRVALLREAGYENLLQISQAKDWELTGVNGIGEKQVESIRNITAYLTSQIASHTGIRLSVGDDSEENRRLIRSIASYRQCQLIRGDAQILRRDLHELALACADRRMIRSIFGWIFSGREKKAYTRQTLEEVIAFCRSPQFSRCVSLLDQYGQAAEISPEEAEKDFEKNSAWYYTLIEKEGFSGISQDLIYSSIPARLAAEIDGHALDLTMFHGDLRSYQAFAAKYILHQKHVLLGDEMGLGKTIEAIAAMADLQARDPKARFLIVCPASVLVNWCREIARFSAIKAHLIHGPFLEAAFRAWQNEGGAAVTNYEMMGRIIEKIDEKMRLSMLIIDEAHYIKNPKAMRSRYIRRLDNEAERILLMTGTPLENHVMEMCSLIDFIRPDLSDQVRAAAAMTHIPEFKEMLSPVYLRRQAGQVLEELPPVTWKEEWCPVTEADLASYQEAVRSKSFPAMRRISFLQDDLSASSKAARLLEICGLAREEGRRVLIYSYFRETIDKVSRLLGSLCAGIITGSVPAADRQVIVDRFSDAPAGSALICQVQAGGTGLNIQAASIIVFCEPQIKPSLTSQAVARAQRMGQIRNVIVFHLLCEGTVDEAVMQILEEKQVEFDTYADESAIAGAMYDIIDSQWIRDYIEQENKKYLPAVIS